MDRVIYFALLSGNIASLISAVPLRSHTEAYCWRDFKGIVPSDALSPGFDKNGKPLYIGQVLAEDKLIPGRIHEDDDNIYYEFGEQAWSSKDNIKILCTQTPEDFLWVSTTHREVTKLSDVLIKGGHEPGFNTYIGRVSKNGKINVGKVICRKTECLALYVNEDGKYVEYHEFDILTYNPTSDNLVKRK